MRISIIIPIYNAESYIRTMIDSINNQSYNEQIEIIAAYDTKSTDRTLDILTELQQTSRHVIRIDQAEDTSIGSARNRGLRLATGDLIFFADADDYLAKNCIQNIVNAFDKFPDLNVVTFDWKYILEKNFNKTSKKYDNKPINNSCKIIDNVTVLHGFWVSRKYTICAWGYVFTRSFIEKHDLHFPDYSHGEDQIYVLNGIVNSKDVGYIPEVNYIYVIHKSSVSHKFRSTQKFWNDHEPYRHDYFNIVGDKFPSIESVAYMDYFRWFLFESTKYSKQEFKQILDMYGIRTLPVVFGTSIIHTLASILFNINSSLFYYVARMFRMIRSF